MLPDLRVAVAAVLASLLLIVTAFGLAATVRIAQHAKIGPIEPPRALAYADPGDWELRAHATRALPLEPTRFGPAAAESDATPERQASAVPAAEPANSSDGAGGQRTTIDTQVAGSDTANMPPEPRTAPTTVTAQGTGTPVTDAPH